jgi:hypothetical protein
MLPLEEIALLKAIERRRKRSSIYRRLGWLNFKFAIGFWAIAQFFVPPVSVAIALGPYHYLWSILTLIGASVSATGLIMTFWPTRRKLATVLELVGLVFMIFGTFLYFAIQGLLLLQGPLSETLNQRGGLTIYAWAMVCAIVARLLAVIPRFHKE